MRVWWILGLAISIPLASGTLPVTDEAQIWKSSGLNLSLVGRLISNPLCDSSPLYHKSCEAALPGAHGDFDRALAELPSSEKIYGRLLNAQLRVFDPHARLVPTAVLAVDDTSDDSRFAGVGIGTTEGSSGLQVREIYPNSPAEHADLRIGDRILAIDGGRPILERFLRPLGTRLHLKIEREGEHLMRIVEIGWVERQVVESRLLARETGYLRVSRFARGACASLRQQMGAMNAKARAWILDLRGNPGGLLAEGRCVAGLFNRDVERVMGEQSVNVEMPAGLGLKRGSEAMSIEWEYAQPAREFASQPLVVLMDHGSASASEMVAAALQDEARALVIGERSFGKGSAQVVEGVLGYPGLLVVHTDSLFFRPSGAPLQRCGVTPDISLARENAPREAEIFRDSLIARSEPLIADLPRESARASRRCIEERDPSRRERRDPLALAAIALECYD